MKPAKNLTEKYVSLNKLINKLLIKYSTGYKICVKNKFRFFKFNGVRCLLVDDAVCLIEYVAFHKLSTSDMITFTTTWLISM